MTALPSILFTTIYDPAHILDRWAATDQMAYRLTRGQGIFTMEEHAHAWPLHILAQNVDSPSRVLEWPTREAFIQELGQGSWDYVCISFMNRDINKLRDMSALIRELQPNAQIVIGGYGVICLPDHKSVDHAPDYDHICREEGVEYLRRLLGQREHEPVVCRMPMSGSSLPWISQRRRGSVGAILASLGCTKRCPFCATSFYTSGRRDQLMDEAAIFAAMKNYWKTNPFTTSVNIYDENYLDYKDRVTNLGAMIRNDDELGLEHLNFFTFGSISAVCKYDPEELLLCGLDTVWVGVESLFTNLKKAKKKNGALEVWGEETPKGLTDATEVFRTLHDSGIKTIGSWIAGLDVQNTANISRDIAYFVSLGATFQQVSILTIEPEMPWAKRFNTVAKDGGRYPWENYHLYGQTFEPKNFDYPQLLDVVENVYASLYETHGPSVMRVLRTNVNGYRTCKNSKHEQLRGPKAAYFQRRIRAYSPLLRSCETFAPTERVASGIRELRREITELFGPFSREHEDYEAMLLRRAEVEHEHLAGRERGPRPDDQRCYSYAAGIENRGGKKPYRLESLVVRPRESPNPSRAEPRPSLPDSGEAYRIPASPRVH
ncbi:B12-binding domain-containing radical SAM protein [Paraliomyxa miuraensis]|uniref:B12-binding domain-containing radical SAM protein n=1 Tax=Paraliomyxa miuraensis TaxID=376150 RepID=UPI0022564A49|nr:hypothetical protein [Paraliomyxa miuraensis]MCX4243005.1 hypothetical protein [Paraliomyxa miuraensis]